MFGEQKLFEENTLCAMFRKEQTAKEENQPNKKCSNSAREANKEKKNTKSSQYRWAENLFVHIL